MNEFTITTEKKFNELSQREVLVSEPRENERGKFRYVECAYWEDRKSKDEDTKEKPGRVKLEDKQRSREIFADGVNSFNVHYQETGNSRIKIYDVRGVPHFKRMDSGLLVPHDKASEIEQSGRVEWERESFARDMAAEIEDVLERYRQRALENQYFDTKADRRGTTYAGQVASGANDAYQRGDDFSFDRSGSLSIIQALGNANGRYNAGWRFSGTMPAQGVTINSATMTIRGWSVSETSADDINCRFHCQNADTTSDFISDASVNGRSRTTASLNQIATAIHAANVWWTSGNMASVVQEVVDRGGYDESSICVLAIANTNNNYQYYNDTYESSSAKAAKLDIDYTAGASGPQNKFGRSIVFQGSSKFDGSKFR